MKVRLNKIRESRFNVREEYDLNSLNISKGIQQKVVVIVVDDAKYDYELVTGHRRLRKAKEQKLKEIDVEFLHDILKKFPEEITEKDILKFQATENLQRKNWNPIEEGKHFKLQLSKGISKEQIAKNIGKEIKYVEQRIFLVNNLDKEIGYSVSHPTHDPEKDRCSITFRKAYELARLPKDEQKSLADRIKEEGLTTEELKRIIKNAEKVKSRLENLETSHPKVAKTVKEYWYPLRFNNVYRDMEQEIKIRMGQVKTVEYFLPCSIATKEEAEKYAKDHMGEYLGTVTKSWHRLLIVPNTIKELRRKWEKEKE